MPEALHNNDVERRMELASIFSGLIDPTTGYTDGITDAMDPSVAQSCLTLLHNIVGHRLAKKDETKARNKKERGFSREKIQSTIDLWAKTIQ
jgi:hypothetical protein